jgi:hypothetical protein
MNKYLLRLSGGSLLSNWEVRHQDIDLRGLQWFVEGQFNMFPNVYQIDVFDDSINSRPFIGKFVKRTVVDWRPE